MAENKKQHYIPKLYLKLFSINNDETNIGLYHLPNHVFRTSVPLKNQAYENYFYGEGSEIEKQLCALEGLASPSLKNIIKSNLLPKKNEAGYHNVFCFTMITGNRTKDTAEEINASAHRMAQLMAQHDPEMSKLLEEKYELRMDNAAVIGIQATAANIDTLADLKVKLIINKTNIKFISSDNPVVKYNQFLVRRNSLIGNVGFMSKGLQIFFPISPNHLLIYYDELIYKIGNRQQNVIEIINTTDVDMLNSLQILNCYEHLYFNNEIGEKYIRLLSDKIIPQRTAEYIKVKQIEDYIDKEGRVHELYHSHRENIQTNLQLSFVKETKNAKSYVMEDNPHHYRKASLKEYNPPPR